MLLLVALFERSGKIDWETGELQPVSNLRQGAHIAYQLFEKAWICAWVGAAIFGVVYAGLYEIGWWALLVLICPAVVFLGSLRYR